MTFNYLGRYSVTHTEDFEPGSNEQVLKNKLGIKSEEVMAAQEESELIRAESELLAWFKEGHQFTAANICDIHHLWLSDIYFFAGDYRTTNLEKNGFPFAASNRIGGLMEELERNFLKKYTPCHNTDIDELAYALGIVHAELILIHPFREGNGRVARLLADLMVSQARRPPLNYGPIDKTVHQQGFERYILAIHASHKRDYGPIKEIFKLLLTQHVT